MSIPDHRIKAALQEMDEYLFEEFISDIWERQGWKTEVTRGAGDKGIDIIAKMDHPIEQTHLIQAKRYAAGNKVSSPEIQQYSSLRKQEDADSVIVITTSSFTAQASELANSLNVKLVDSDELCEIICVEEAYDILESYTGETIEAEVDEDDGLTIQEKKIESPTDRSGAESVRQKLIEVFTHHLEMAEPGIVQIDFLHNDVERMYYQFREGHHMLSYMENDEFQKAQSIAKGGEFEITNADSTQGQIMFGRLQDLSLAEVENEVDLFIGLLEDVYGENLKSLTRIESTGSRTDDGYRAF